MFDKLQRSLVSFQLFLTSSASRLQPSSVIAAAVRGWMGSPGKGSKVLYTLDGSD